MISFHLLETGDDGYSAKFVSDSIETTVAYSYCGVWEYTMKKYMATKMPGILSALVERSFPGYAIQDVSEIMGRGINVNTLYSVLTKHGINYKLSQICNNERKIVELLPGVKAFKTQGIS